jgi:hypothetical protein
MQYLHKNSHSSHVTALFADRALSFALPKGATFQDLVDRLIFLDGREPVAVIVYLDSRTGRRYAGGITVPPA